jgi:hypothetical protein
MLQGVGNHTVATVKFAVRDARFADLLDTTWQELEGTLSARADARVRCAGISDDVRGLAGGVADFR